MFKILCVLQLSRKIEVSPFGTSNGGGVKDIRRMNINNVHDDRCEAV